MKKAGKLTNAERTEIAILLKKNHSLRSIAKELERSPNTISYEIRVNSVDGVYLAVKAKSKARLRRRSSKFQWRKISKNTKLKEYIIIKLNEHWNPDQISGQLRLEHKAGRLLDIPYISKTNIYDWLHSSGGQACCGLLYSRRYRVKKHKDKNVASRTMIPSRIGIEKRSKGHSSRKLLGNWEYDSVVSSKASKSKYVLAVAVERKTRFALAVVLPSLKPADFSNSLARSLSSFKVKSLTTDNGIENKRHKFITQSLNGNPPVYFTDPYSSWQKGSVENINKMIRRYYPKGTDFATITQESLNKVIAIINNKPRKILGYKSSLQLAKEKGLFLLKK